MDKNKSSLLFPGQGSQVIGMGVELFNTFNEAKEVFSLIDETLKQNLSQLMFSGKLEELTLTANAQPAIMAVSLAVMAVLEKQLNLTIQDLCKVAAGHSLGEYSALAASGVFSLTDTAHLLRVRGNAMQSAVNPGEGAMVALIGTDLDSAQKLCNHVANYGACQIANDNGAGQIVLSGATIAIDKAIESATNFGIKKAIKLKVSAPFHSSLMQSAAFKMEQALKGIAIHNPTIDVIANFNVEKHYESITKDLLVSQVAGSVRWRETMEKITTHYEVDTFIEIGPGQVLSGIAKRMYPESNIFNLHTPKNIEEFSDFL
ncbi:MAG: ACP S-malonyltransferase [Candidatus Midichloria sp.]|nr:ACP S-malonyltransferase [Candidatus Midichloria sp.]